jgi:hypothetical protein
VNCGWNFTATRAVNCLRLSPGASIKDFESGERGAEQHCSRSSSPCNYVRKEERGGRSPLSVVFSFLPAFSHACARIHSKRGNSTPSAADVAQRRADDLREGEGVVLGRVDGGRRRWRGVRGGGGRGGRRP